MPDVKEYLLLTSDERSPSSASTTDFTVQLPVPISRVVKTDLIQISMDYNVANIAAPDNELVINYKNGDGQSFINTIVLEDGLYTLDVLASWLEEQFNKSVSGVWSVYYTTGSKLMIERQLPSSSGNAPGDNWITSYSTKLAFMMGMSPTDPNSLYMPDFTSQVYTVFDYVKYQGKEYRLRFNYTREVSPAATDVDGYPSSTNALWYPTEIFFYDEGVHYQKFAYVMGSGGVLYRLDNPLVYPFTQPEPGNPPQGVADPWTMVDVIPLWSATASYISANATATDTPYHPSVVRWETYPSAPGNVYWVRTMTSLGNERPPGEYEEDHGDVGNWAVRTTNVAPTFNATDGGNGTLRWTLTSSVQLSGIHPYLFIQSRALGTDIRTANNTMGFWRMILNDPVNYQVSMVNNRVDVYQKVPSELQHIDVKLLFPDGRTVSNNGGRFSMLLEIIRRI